MKISEMINNLQIFMYEHGDLDCWYAEDDEGNGYHPVGFAPSLYYVDEYGEVYTEEDCDDDLAQICIVN